MSDQVDDYNKRYENEEHVLNKYIIHIKKDKNIVPYEIKEKESYFSASFIAFTPDLYKQTLTICR